MFWSFADSVIHILIMNSIDYFHSELFKGKISDDLFVDLAAHMQLLDDEKKRVNNRFAGLTLTIQARSWMEKADSTELEAIDIIDWRQIQQAAAANPDSSINKIVKDKLPECNPFLQFQRAKKAIRIIDEVKFLRKNSPRPLVSDIEETHYVSVPDQDLDITSLPTNTQVDQGDQEMDPGANIGILNRAVTIYQTNYVYIGEQGPPRKKQKVEQEN